MSDDNKEHKASRISFPKRCLRWCSYVAVFAIVLVIIAYARLVAGPVSLHFASDRLQNIVASVIDDAFAVEWDDFGLSLTGPFSAAFRLEDVKLTERDTDAVIGMEALEIAISPLSMIWGKPQARITLVKPQIQMVQYLTGPILARLNVEEDADTGVATVSILEGQKAASLVEIGTNGLMVDIDATSELDLRSDNDWLVFNVEALNDALSSLAERAIKGELISLAIRDGEVGMLDNIYGFYRIFNDLNMEVRAGREDGRVTAIFAATVAGKTMHGTMAKRVTGDVTQIDADIEYIDMATIIPFLDDAKGIAALRGVGSLGMSLSFDTASGDATGGNFTVDLSGTSLRLDDDYFPINTKPFKVNWTPKTGLFHFDNVEFSAGKSKARVTGNVMMGLDENYGPTVSLQLRAEDVWLHPEDMDAPEEPFDAITFEGWSAPLYGATGIDRLMIQKKDARILANGRLDMVRAGLGMDISIVGAGASADDAKRIWPYLFATEARAWFLEYVGDGHIDTTRMRFNFPVGSLENTGENEPYPEDSLNIELAGRDLELRPIEGMPSLQVAGAASVHVQDQQLTIAFEKAIVGSGSNLLNISNATFLNQDTTLAEQYFELSGDVHGAIPMLIDLASSKELNLLDPSKLDVDLKTIGDSVVGNVNATVIATIALDREGNIAKTDYALNGTIAEMKSKKAINGFNFQNANLSFTASQAGFRVVGTGEVQGIPLDVQATQAGQGAPEVIIGSTFNIAQAKAVGIDLSKYLSGEARLAAKAMEDGSFQVTTDLQNTAINIAEIGVTKARGTAGTASSTVRYSENGIVVSGLDIRFGKVHLQGNVQLDSDGELKSAEFSTFKLSDGDNARISISSTNSGLALNLTGQQFDMKPVLKQFFNLEGGEKSSGLDQALAIRVRLDRVIGYYSTAIFNVDLDMAISGTDLRRLNLQAALGGDKTMSATTNLQPSGRAISYASNDIAGVLRFIGIYPRLVGGEGTFVLRRENEFKRDIGEVVLKNFSIMDEQNLSSILAAHEESRQYIGKSSTMSFKEARASVAIYDDYIEVVDATLHGESIGGTLRGNIFTKAAQYDLTGTYVPMFAVNNVFQKIPIIGPIFGGREGEGLLGVTFAVRGALAEPKVMVNPVSILAPGMFRSLFEYKTQ